MGVAPLDDRASISERGLNIGYPFGWHAVEQVDFVQLGEVKPLRYFDKDLAILRGEDGKPDG